MWKLKVCFALLITSLTFGLGWYLKPEVVCPPCGQMVTKTKVVEKTVEKRPDGTIVETEITKDIDSTKKDLDKPAKKDYNMGIGIASDFGQKPEWGDVEVSVGRRLLGDLWGELEWRNKTNQIGLGLKWEF